MELGSVVLLWSVPCCRCSGGGCCCSGCSGVGRCCVSCCGCGSCCCIPRKIVVVRHQGLVLGCYFSVGYDRVVFCLQIGRIILGHRLHVRNGFEGWWVVRLGGDLFSCVGWVVMFP